MKREIGGAGVITGWGRNKQLLLYISESASLYIYIIYNDTVTRAHAHDICVVTETHNVLHHLNCLKIEIQSLET